MTRSMPRWSPEQIATLITEYPPNGAKHCARVLDKNVTAVKVKAWRLGLSCADKRETLRRRPAP